MAGFTESNITLDFPDNNYFRFQDCPAYKTLSGKCLKEMDACWYDKAKNICWFIELKDFSSPQISLNLEDRISDILKKAIDTLVMFVAAKHGYYSDLNNCFPFIANNETEIRFMTIVHIKNSLKPDIQHVHNEFRNKFEVYAKLFKIKYYAIIEILCNY